MQTQVACPHRPYKENNSHRHINWFSKKNSAEIGLESGDADFQKKC
jgi:hypothetical protein